eukprot:TRINITY_DN21047_c0_g1_i1.p1 TRINITY_DN21047_c0_g1~~TRINITY_DN21047_c0_g1_i1.p1  ORF type:complete len:162 (+),score=10.17 TRINITY_DN21047_c0_g1_i1:218-703(+)
MIKKNNSTKTPFLKKKEQRKKKKKKKKKTVMSFFPPIPFSLFLFILQLISLFPLPLPTCPLFPVYYFFPFIPQSVVQAAHSAVPTKAVICVAMHKRACCDLSKISPTSHWLKRNIEGHADCPLSKQQQLRVLNFFGVPLTSAIPPFYSKGGKRQQNSCNFP